MSEIREFCSGQTIIRRMTVPKTLIAADFAEFDEFVEAVGTFDDDDSIRAISGVHTRNNNIMGHDEKSPGGCIICRDKLGNVHFVFNFHI